jgi:ribose transport system ATP-binding protein
LILDEPTASLTRREIEQLFALVMRLREAGTAILYVTHHLREVLEIADHVSIMRDGRIVANRGVSRETTEAELVELLIGRTPSMQPAAPVASARVPLLKVSDLRTSGSSSGVSFHIDDGEIVGLYGVVGCGREEIGRALVGLHPVLGGAVELTGETYKARDPADALARGIGFLSSDRKQEGILPNRSIRENLTLCNLRAVARRSFIQPRLERTMAAEQLRALGVKFGSAEHFISTLSGGSQQKVLFGRALAARPSLLVLEDPTAGIDIGAKHDLYRIIRSHAGDGMSFLWMSSDLTETLTLCDRIYAMYDGRIVSEIAAPTMADEEHLLAAVLGRGGAASRT